MFLVWLSFIVVSIGKQTWRALPSPARIMAVLFAHLSERFVHKICANLNVCQSLLDRIKQSNIPSNLYLLLKKIIWFQLKWTCEDFLTFICYFLIKSRSISKKKIKILPIWNTTYIIGQIVIINHKLIWSFCSGDVSILKEGRIFILDFVIACS